MLKLTFIRINRRLKICVKKSFKMNYADWNSHELARQIQALGFGQYTSMFIKNEVCGVHLPLITEEHLSEMGVKKIGHRVLLIRRFSDIINNKIPTQVSASASAGTSSRYSSPNIDQNNTDNIYADDNLMNNDYKRREIPRSPNTKKYVDPSESQKSAIEKKYNRMTKNTPTEDSDGSSYSSTSHRSRSTRNPSTKNKSNLNNVNNNSNSNFGATETVGRSSRANPSASSSMSNEQNINISQENDNRITCQYCGRKFQPEAAQRHIPVCGRINGKNLKR